MRIMVIDDSEDGRDVAEAMLLDAGYEEISTADSAEEAYRFLGIGGPPTQELSPIDLVLLDILMPEVDGIAVCKRIHNEKRYADVPIIMVTSLGDMVTLKAAFMAGATDYIAKPLNGVELMARVRSALKLKSELDRRRAREQELLQFMSTWGDRRASHWIDNTTGLFVGEVVEAYLVASASIPSSADTSIIALAVDHLDTYRSTQGDAVAAGIMSQVARAVRTTAATVGVVAAAYRDGAIVLVVPELRSKPALALGESLRASISKLGITNPASAATPITASVAVVTGRVNCATDSVHLLTRALSAIPKLAAEGGDRVVPELV